jgi:hypothetical protein
MSLNKTMGSQRELMIQANLIMHICHRHNIHILIIVSTRVREADKESKENVIVMLVFLVFPLPEKHNLFVIFIGFVYIFPLSACHRLPSFLFFRLFLLQLLPLQRLID